MDRGETMGSRRSVMCRNIRPLFNFEPEATGEELRDAALQYVRKISGMRSPSKANRDTFDRVVDEIAMTCCTVQGHCIRRGMVGTAGIVAPQAISYDNKAPWATLFMAA